MRRWFKAAPLAVLLLSAVPARASRVYDPEIALLLLQVQKQSVDLVRAEMLRQAEWLGLGSMKVLLPADGAAFAERVRAGLTMDSDVVDDYRRAIVDASPGDAGDADKLVAELRRYHDLVPGPPMSRVVLPAGDENAPTMKEEKGVGGDVLDGIRGASQMGEPLAFAERRFGTLGPFLRRRKWNLDFYLGSFRDLAPEYRRLGYRRAYRLRAPFVSYGRSVYVLSPEPGVRPRLVLCEFYGRDLFTDARAQWATLTRAARGQGPIVRTLTCLECSWTLPGVKAMRSLLATLPYAADAVVVGYDDLFADAWKNDFLGTYENDYWRLTFYKHPLGTVATLRSLHTDFGEILGESLGPLVRRGARFVFFGGPAASIRESVDESRLARPTEFVSYEGPTIPFANALTKPGAPRTAFGDLPSPLFDTREWVQTTQIQKIVAFDGEMTRLADAAGRWRREGIEATVGIGAVLGGLASLHPEADRAVYTVDYADQDGREAAKKEFRDAVLSALNAAARGKNR